VKSFYELWVVDKITDLFSSAGSNHKIKQNNRQPGIPIEPNRGKNWLCKNRV